MKTNCHGFTALLMLSLLPLLGTLFLGLALVLGFQNSLLAPRQMCRKAHLEVQRNAEKSISKLLALNKTVQTMRTTMIELKTARAAAIVALQPEIVESLNLQIAALQSAQITILNIQKSLLLHHQLSSQALQFRLRQDLLRLTQAPLDFFIQTKISEVKSAAHALAVRSDLDTKVGNSEPGIYSRLDNFSEKESSSTQWTLLAKANPNHWIANKINGRFRWHDTCSASLFKFKNEWEAKLWNNIRVDRFW